MNGYGFTSALAPQLDAYLTFKQKMGCYGNSRIWYLKRFDAYCTAHDRATSTGTRSKDGSASSWPDRAGTGRGCPTSATPAVFVIG